jgi:hypothetical protein
MEKATSKRPKPESKVQPKKESEPQRQTRKRLPLCLAFLNVTPDHVTVTIDKPIAYVKLSWGNNGYCGNTPFMLDPGTGWEDVSQSGSRMVGVRESTTFGLRLWSGPPQNSIFKEHFVTLDVTHGKPYGSDTR